MSRHPTIVAAPHQIDRLAAIPRGDEIRTIHVLGTRQHRIEPASVSEILGVECSRAWQVAWSDGARTSVVPRVEPHWHGVPSVVVYLTGGPQIECLTCATLAGGRYGHLVCFPSDCVHAMRFSPGEHAGAILVANLRRLPAWYFAALAVAKRGGE